MAEDVPSSTNQTPRHYGQEKTITTKPEKFKEGLKFETKEEQAILINLYNINGALVEQEEFNLIPSQEKLEMLCLKQEN